VYTIKAGTGTSFNVAIDQRLLGVLVLRHEDLYLRLEVFFLIPTVFVPLPVRGRLFAKIILRGMISSLIPAISLCRTESRVLESGRSSLSEAAG